MREQTAQGPVVQDTQVQKPGEGRYEVWHAREIAAMMTPPWGNVVRWKGRDAEYDKVAEIETVSLSAAFARTQHGEWDWTATPCVRWLWDGRTRSTSVGDVFVFNGQAWLVKAMGFEPIETLPDKETTQA